jgi:hypothetical protein
LEEMPAMRGGVGPPRNGTQARRAAMTKSTPTPWAISDHTGNIHRGWIKSVCRGFPERIVAQALGQETVEERDANASLIVAAVNNHAPMLSSLESCAKLFDTLAIKLDRWATESRMGGWSTHQVDENIKTAADCRRYAAQIRSALPNGESK